MQEIDFMERSEHSIILIGVCGGSGSGKTTLANCLMKMAGLNECALIGQDSYYIDQSARFDGDGGSVNFDHPESIDFQLMSLHLQQLKQRFTVQVPIYEFATHRRLPITKSLDSFPLIIVDGTLILSQEKIRQELTTSIFLDISEDTRFQRRLKRDVQERGRHPDGVKKQFYQQVQPMHEQFVQPSKQFSQWIYNGEQTYEDLVERILSAFPLLSR